MNRGHNKECELWSYEQQEQTSHHMIIITTTLLLKTTSNKISFMMLKWTIKMDLDFITTFIGNRTDMGEMGNKIPRADTLKRSDFLSHRKLSFRMKNNITISQFRKNSTSKTLPNNWSKTIQINRLTRSMTTTKKWLRWRITRWGWLGRRRWFSRTRWSSTRSWSIRRIEHIRWQSRNIWEMVACIDLCHRRFHDVVWKTGTTAKSSKEDRRQYKRMCQVGDRHTGHSSIKYKQERKWVYKRRWENNRRTRVKRTRLIKDHIPRHPHPSNNQISTISLVLSTIPKKQTQPTDLST